MPGGGVPQIVEGWECGGSSRPDSSRIGLATKKKGATTMRKYQIIERKNSRALREFLVREGQVLLPFLESIERTEKALDEVIDVAGRATIEAVLDLSAKSVAGERHPGKKGPEIRWHERQGELVSLAERQVRVSRPRLRRKGKGRGEKSRCRPMRRCGARPG